MSTSTKEEGNGKGRMWSYYRCGELVGVGKFRWMACFHTVLLWFWGCKLGQFQAWDGECGLGISRSLHCNLLDPEGCLGVQYIDGPFNKGTRSSPIAHFQVELPAKTQTQPLQTAPSMRPISKEKGQLSHSLTYTSLVRWCQCSIRTLKLIYLVDKSKSHQAMTF